MNDRVATVLVEHIDEAKNQIAAKKLTEKEAFNSLHKIFGNMNAHDVCAALIMIELRRRS